MSLLPRTTLSRQSPGKSVAEREPIPGEHYAQHHACHCPICPRSSPPSGSTSQSQKTRTSPSSKNQPPESPLFTSPDHRKEPCPVPVGLGVSLSLGFTLEENKSVPTSAQQLEDDKTSSPIPHSNSDSPTVSPSPLSTSQAQFHHYCPLANSTSCAEPSFLCLSSQRAFPNGSQLHRQQHDQQGLQQLPCMHCSASFPRPSQLLHHQRIQHASKAGGFLCTECGRAFNSHSNLRIHLNVHTGARPYICSDCGKSFSQSGALKIHRRIHTGEKPYICSFCGRGFPHLAGVRAHQRIHTGEKPYHCGQCGKCFTQSGALKIHTRIHTGERPFVCGHCGKTFSNRTGIRFHHRTVHGIVMEPNSVGRPSLAVTSASDFHIIQVSDLYQINFGHVEERNLFGRQTEQFGVLGAKVVLPYACEDCDQRFLDALSRNKHQALEHCSPQEKEERDSDKPKD